MLTNASELFGYGLILFPGLIAVFYIFSVYCLVWATWKLNAESKTIAYWIFIALFVIMHVSFAYFAVLMIF